jgi:hypothetical protein
LEFASFITMQMPGIYLALEQKHNEISLSKKLMRKTMGTKRQRHEEGSRSPFLLFVSLSLCAFVLYFLRSLFKKSSYIGMVEEIKK